MTMKKFFTITALVLCTGLITAQSDSRFYDTEGSYKERQAAGDPGTGGGIGGEDPQPAPIDDYLPLLLIAGITMAVYYARKKQVKTES